MKKYSVRYSILSISISLFLYSKISAADDYFDPNLLNSNAIQNQNVDLSVFNKQGGQAAGIYQTNIYLNTNYIDERKVHFDHIKGSNTLYPLLTKEDYVKFGVMANATPDFMNIPNDQVIEDISKVIPDAFIKYDFTQSQLNISIPQLYVSKIAQGAVPESLWDDGITALFTNYSYSGSTTKIDGQSGSTQNTYLNLRSGFNFGAWRVRNYGTYSHSNHIDRWRNINTYVQRDIRSLKGQLVIGESTTPSDMFDSFSFRGIQLSSDDAMEPASLRGFSPTVRGIANSNAQVTIRQNGNIIWQSYVPPGPFVIDDLYPTSASGDLEVTIKESDGSTRTFMQAFSSVAIMVREGRFKYSVTAGEYRSNLAEANREKFLQVTGIYGLPYTSTVYSGAIFSQNYNSLLLGIGKSLGYFGSVSLDATVANAKINDENNTGGSFRFQYSKESLSTGTSFTLAGYRYSTSKYRDFSEVNNSYAKDNTDANYYAWQSKLNKRDKLQLNMNQSLNEFGSIYLTAYQQKYWNVNNKERSLNIGYNNSYNGISYSFNYANNKDLYKGTSDQIFSFSVQIPFSFKTSSAWLNLATNADDKGNNTSTVGISGSALEDSSLQYYVQEGYTNRGTGYSGSTSVNYKASFGEYQLGYNYTRNTQQINYSAMGSVVIHPYGVNFSQAVGETASLVRAKGAGNVRLMNHTGVYTDRQGNAIVPYVSPYQQNVLSLDPASTGKNIDLLTNTKIVVPTRGAIVLANYPAQIGYKIFVTLLGSSIPFGAEATINNNGSVSSGIVDDGQKVYLSGAPVEGVINVKWGSGQCNAPYKLTDLGANLALLSVSCD